MKDGDEGGEHRIRMEEVVLTTVLANQSGGSKVVGKLSPPRQRKHACLEEQLSDGWNEYLKRALEQVALGGGDAFKERKLVEL